MYRKGMDFISNLLLRRTHRDFRPPALVRKPVDVFRKESAAILKIDWRILPVDWREMRHTDGLASRSVKSVNLTAIRNY